MSTALQPTARLAFLDQLRAITTLLVVFHHTSITYGGAGSWYYKEFPGNLGHGLTATLLTLFCAVNQAWFMGAFFLLAGYVTPGPYERKGPLRFVLERAFRLGIPLLIYGFFLDALTNAIARMSRERDFAAVLWDEVAQLHYGPGPLWFAQALMLFALVYVGWRTLRPANIPDDDAPLPPHRVLLLAALATGAAAFAVRLFAPVGSEFAHMQLGYFPSYVVLFAFGCIAARHRWLARIDWVYARPWWIVSLITLPILPAAALGYRAMTHESVQVGGGFNFGALLYAFWEPFLAWGVLLTLLWYFRTQVSAGRFRGLARRAYAIYCFHPPVVVAFSVALASWGAPAAVKFVTVGTLSCAALYLLTGWLLRIRLLACIW